MGFGFPDVGSALETDEEQFGSIILKHADLTLVKTLEQH
jgi:hypothetical protein